MNNSEIKYVALGSGSIVNKYKLVEKYATNLRDPLNVEYLKSIRNILQKVSENKSEVTRGYVQKIEYDEYITYINVSGYDETVYIYFIIISKDSINKVLIQKIINDYESLHINETPFDIICQKLLQMYGEDKLKRVEGQVEEIKLVMKENILKSLENADRLEDVQIASRILEEEAKEFEIGARDVKRIECSRKWKLQLIIALIVVVVLIAIVTPIITRS